MLETKGCCQCDGTQVDPRVAELEQVIEEYRGMEGALIMILHKAQEIYGYLPEDVQRTVAKALDIPLTDVYGVATFYSYFSLTPRGKYRIAVCMGTACYVRGAGELLSAFERELGVKSGETTEDMSFTLQASRCIGACGLAPVLTVNEDVYGSVTADKVGEILKKYRS
jgi:NADH-quinone oxidoreductase E subunit